MYLSIPFLIGLRPPPRPPPQKKNMQQGTIISNVFLNISHPISSNLHTHQYTLSSILVVTKPIPPLASIKFFYQLYTSLSVSLPLIPAYTLYSFVRSFETILAVLMWSETKMNKLCIIFERIRGVPQQSGGSYSRKATKMKTGNRYREIEIRLLLIA